MDFSADVLVKILKQIPQITTWKIEGRKKSPHYVYYTVKAYKLLRDEPDKKKQALAYLEYALGREFSHYNLLSQRVINPLDHESETGSGLFAGRIKNPAAPFFITREALLPSDLLRIGFEDDQFHDIQKVTRAVPKKGKFYLDKQSKFKIKKGTPVYIIDRRGQELLSVINPLKAELSGFKTEAVRPIESKRGLPFSQHRAKLKIRTSEITLSRGRIQPRQATTENAVWISTQGYSISPSPRNWLWLDPLLFPDEQKMCADYIARAIKKGAKNFVLNAVWQICLFQTPKRLNLWAGPFCNITNSMTVNLLNQYGFSGAIVSPELDQETFCSLPQKSELPLGIVVYGNWPLGISRIISKELKPNQAFTSPMGETAWMSKHNNNYFVFPNWQLDLRSKTEQLEQAGFSLFVNIHENIPRTIKMKNRPGLWNWNLNLL